MPMPRYFANGLLVFIGRKRKLSPSFSKRSLSPARTPNARRTLTGTVIWPLLVIFACIFIASFQSLTLPWVFLLLGGSPVNIDGRSRLVGRAERPRRTNSKDVPQ